jgi:hypothetical protein
MDGDAAGFVVAERETEIADVILRGHADASNGLVLDICQADLSNPFMSHVLPARDAAP